MGFLVIVKYKDGSVRRFKALTDSQIDMKICSINSHWLYGYSYQSTKIVKTVKEYCDAGMSLMEGHLNNKQSISDFFEVEIISTKADLRTIENKKLAYFSVAHLISNILD